MVMAQDFPDKSSKRPLMDRLMVPVIYGSVRHRRMGIRAARYVVSALEKRGIEPVLIDPMEYQLPLLDKMYKEFKPGEAPEMLEKLAKLYRKADGFVIVSGEYNQSIPPALANILDYFLEEYFWRPAGIVTYSNGRFSGARSGYALRTMLGEMGMVTMPSMFQIANVQDAFNEHGAPANPKMDEYSQTFFDELVWYMNALKPARAAGVPY
jgi:NAD(P)H-dependent FMN reductase